MKLNKILTRDTWAQGESAIDSNGNPVHWESLNADRRDLSSSLMYYYDNNTDLVYTAISKIKAVIEADPVLSAVPVDVCSQIQSDTGEYVLEDCDTYKAEHKGEVPPLYMFNDAAEWAHIARILILVDLT